MATTLTSLAGTSYNCAYIVVPKIREAEQIRCGSECTDNVGQTLYQKVKP